jgi:uncharacterized protein (TIGR04222 family)
MNILQYALLLTGFTSILILIIRYRINNIVNKKQKEYPDVSEVPDPYLISFLEGGISGLAYMLLYKLVKTDYLSISKKCTHFRKKLDSSSDLSALDKIVYKHFSVSRKTQSLRERSISNKLRNEISNLDVVKQYPGLIFTENERNQITDLRNIFIGLSVFIAFIVSMVSGSFWLMVFASGVSLFSILKLSRLPSNTSAAESYIAQLKLVYQKPDDSFQSMPLIDQLIGVALFGSYTLGIIGWTELPDTYNRGTDENNSSGCGSGCGSGCSSCGSGSSCGSSGCGGGCGGCGGGGCG